MNRHDRQLVHSGWRRADPPRQPVLFVNPASGGGKAVRAELAKHAREQGIEVSVVGRDRTLAALVREAVEGGADALGVAGGDGSLAVVAAAPSSTAFHPSVFLRARETTLRSTWASTGTTWSVRSRRSPTASSA